MITLSSPNRGTTAQTVPEDSKLRLPDTVNVELLAPDIVVCREIFPWGNELINLANKIGSWESSTQIESKTGNSFVSDARSSSSFRLSCGNTVHAQSIAPFELAVMNALHSGAKAYKAYNPFCEITEDTGYEILKYEQGQGFKEHIDAIPGLREEGARQLTAILYLNCGYEGGHTSFPRQSLVVTPSAGDLLLFPSNFVYPHVSPPVTVGVKYVLVTWFVARPRKV